MRAFDSTGIGIEGRIERALRSREIAQHEVQRLVHDAQVVGLARDLPGMKIGPGQERLIREHLLEMGDQPAGIGRVAAEPAHEMVVDAAGRHGVERSHGHPLSSLGPIVVSARAKEAELDQGRTRELRRRAEAAPLRVEPGGQSLDDVVLQPLRIDTCSVPWHTELGDGAFIAQRLGQAHLLAHGVGESIGLLEHLRLVVLPCLTERLHDAPKGRHAVALLGWKVRAGIEGPAVGGAEDRHRPAARAGQSLGRRHVDGIEVGALLAVDLDRNEPLGQVRSRGRVFEALVSHHVAPVARRIPDGEEDRLVLLLGPVRRPQGPRDTTRPDSRRAGAGRGWSRRPDGSPQGC